MKFHFACPVWGSRAVELYVELGLPSQLAALRDFEHFRTSTYFLYTTTADAVTINQHPTFQRLRQLLPVVIVIDDEMSWRVSWWDSFTSCHRRQVRLAEEEDAATFFLCADQIWSESSLTRAADWILAGSHAVVCAGPRVNQDLATRELLTRVQEGRLSVTGRYLVQHAFTDWLHPECRDSFFDSANYIQYVSCMLFTVPGEGALGRGYVLHPVVIRAQIKNARPDFVIFDQDYLAMACPDPESIYVVQDSDEIGHVSLAPLVMEYAQPVGHDPCWDPIQAQAWFAEGAYWTEIHQEFAQRPIHLHYTDMSPDWQGVRTRSQAIVDSIEHSLLMTPEELLFNYPHNLLRRFDRWRKYGMELSDGDLRWEARAREMIGFRWRRTWKNPITG